MDLKPRDAELIIGIVARIGVDTTSIVNSINEELVLYKYQVFETHVTELLKLFEAKIALVETPLEERYESYIDGCNSLRENTDNSIMARLAIMDIVSKRSSNGPAPDAQSRTAFIINQIKRPEEFELLRQVYGESYVQISCHADEQIRIDRLTVRIAHNHPESPKNSSWDIKARELVHADESQEEVRCGQRVRQVFPLSDVILNVNSQSVSRTSIERFFRALFGDQRVTPTREEYGMELANTAAQRSSDLSRQVGAAILTRTMEIQALGCNEVPKAGGGTYWEGDRSDGRDFALGQDSNEQRRRAVLVDLMLRLKKTKEMKDILGTQAQIESFLFDRSDTIISDAQIMDSLEYGRTVHAEMNAITDAARGGHPIRDCSLFSNTFPCHNCAKHIVASGIFEVIYIHPYPKSYAKELFSDSIIVNPSISSATCADPDKVIFRQFLGIVGPMYARIFTKARWKKAGGTISIFSKTNAYYIRRTPIPPYLKVEELIIDEMNIELREKGYLPSIPKIDS